MEQIIFWFPYIWHVAPLVFALEVMVPLKVGDFWRCEGVIWTQKLGPFIMATLLGPPLKVKLLVGYMQHPTKLKGAKGIRLTEDVSSYIFTEPCCCLLFWVHWTLLSNIQLAGEANAQVNT